MIAPPQNITPPKNSQPTSYYDSYFTVIKTIQKMSIIIPCFNEGATIIQLLCKVLDAQIQEDISKEIVLINDASTDSSDTLIRAFLSAHPQLPVLYCCHETNRGKGAAIRTALQYATGDYVIIQDADLEYEPFEYPKLLAPIIDGYADIVYGSRFIGGNAHRILFFWHTTGNKLLTLLSNILTNMHLSDAHTCYKLLPTELLKRLGLKENGFAFDAELNVKLSRLKELRIYEVGISYYGRTFKEGKKIRLRDALSTLKSLITYRLKNNLQNSKIPYSLPLTK